MKKWIKDRQKIYRFPITEYLEWFLLYEGIVLTIGYIYFHSWKGGLVLLPFTFFLVEDRRAKCGERQKAGLLQEFQRFIQAMSASLKAGNMTAVNAFMETMKTAEDILPKRSLFLKRLKVMENNLRSSFQARFDDEMMDLARDLESDDIIAFADAVRSCYGIHTHYITNVIERYSNLIEEKRRTMEEIKTMMAEAGFTTRFMTLALPGIILLLDSSMGSMMTSMYTTTRGVFWMSISCVANILLYLWAERLLRVNVGGV